MTLNLSTSTYQPYNKPSDSLLYINTKSNHPPNIKSIPESISRRISTISSNKDIFEGAAPYYNNALSASGYSERIEYKTDTTPAKHRSQNIIWFNPPYSINVKTNIAKTFLHLISKHFPKKHKLHQIFNRNNVKVSYSCLPNVSNIIQSHNKKILSNKQPSNHAGCSCIDKNNCPLDRNCLKRSIVYQGKVSANNTDIVANYTGITENTFKDRLYKHRNSFR